MGSFLQVETALHGVELIHTQHAYIQHTYTACHTWAGTHASRRQRLLLEARALACPHAPTRMHARLVQDYDAALSQQPRCVEAMYRKGQVLAVLKKLQVCACACVCV